MKLLQPRRFHPLKAAWVLLVLAAFALYTSHRDRPPRLWKWTGPTMGSTYTVQIVDRTLEQRGLDALREEVDALLESLNAELSTWLPDSPISVFNRTETTEPFPVSEAFASVTRTALEVSRLSGGAFDITFAPLFDAWGFGRTGPKRTPSDEEIQAARARCGYQNLAVPSSTHIRKAIPGLQVTYNAIVPGFAADQVTSLLRAGGFSNTYVEVGGEIVARGHNLQGEPWRIGIETPVYDAEPGAHIEGVVRLADRALATSGDYRNYFRDEDGAVVSHLFDPRTGRPATTRVAAVTVIAGSGALADALSTTLFVMGPEEGLPWLRENVPDAHALFILRESDGAFRETATPGFEQATGYRPQAGIATAAGQSSTEK